MFKIARNEEDMRKAFTVRSIVFIDEQNTPYDIEVDGLDSKALHVLGEIKGEPVAIGRLERYVADKAMCDCVTTKKVFKSNGIKAILQNMILIIYYGGILE